MEFLERCARDCWLASEDQKAIPINPPHVAGSFRRGSLLGKGQRATTTVGVMVLKDIGEMTLARMVRLLLR